MIHAQKRTMHSFKCAVISLLLVCHLGVAEHLVTIDAASTFFLEGNEYVYLFAGQSVQVIEQDDHKGGAVFNRSVMGLPSDMRVEASVVLTSDKSSPEGIKAMYYGDKYIFRTIYIGEDITSRKIRYGRLRKFIRDGPPDAVGRWSDGNVYFFKGCDMAIRKDWNKWKAPRGISSVLAGVPCDVDAAWKEADTMVILKGDKYWIWEKDGSVNGPNDFNSDYQLKDDWVVASSVE